MKRLRISEINSWIPSYLLTTLLSALTAFTLQMISTGLPLYCVDIGKSTAEAGIFAGFYSVAVIVSRVFVGRLVDSKGKWNIAMIGLVLMGLAIFSMAFIPYLVLFALYQVIIGFAFSAASTAQGAMVLDYLPQNVMIKGIGYFTVFKSLSYSLGASFSSTVSEKFGAKNIFYYIFIIIIIVIALTYLQNSKWFKKNFGLKVKLAEIKKVEIENKIEYKGLDRFIEKSVLPICLVQFFFTFSLTLGTSYLPSYTSNIGLTGVGIYYTVNAFTMFIARVFFSNKIEKMGVIKTFVIGMILAGLSTIGVIFCDQVIYFALLAIPNAIGICFVNPTLNTCSTAYADKLRRGVATSTYFASLDLGSGAGGMIWGLLIPSIGYKNVFIVASLILVVGLIYGYISLNKRRV